MTELVLRRTVEMAVVVLAMSFLVYALIGLMPGDPIDLMISSNPHLTSADASRLRALYGLDRPIVVTTALGFAKSYVSSEMARVGDALLVTKSAGIEGTAALAREAPRLGRSFPKRLRAEASVFERRLSIIPEAVEAFRTGKVHAMHDCTEGGVLGAVFEMSLASGLGFDRDESLVPVAPETASPG